jgi:hypothetical protein
MARLHLYTLRQRISPAAIVEEAGKFANEVQGPPYALNAALIEVWSGASRPSGSARC